MESKRKVIYTITLVILLIAVVVGATYAYFSATAKSDSDIKGNTLDVNLGLSAKKISATGSKSENLIPIYDGSISGYASQLETAAQSKYNCVDKYNYTVCQIYEVTISNSGTNDINVNTTLTFNKNNVNNLKWALMSDANTVVSGNTHTITNNTPDTIATNTMIKGKSSDTKLYFMVYINNTGKDQTEQDKDGFSGVITVSATTGEKITATFN